MATDGRELMRIVYTNGIKRLADIRERRRIGADGLELDTLSASNGAKPLKYGAFLFLVADVPYLMPC